MNRLRTALADVGRRLDEGGFGWALVGGLAVSVRAEPRFTRDVDLAETSIEAAISWPSWSG